MLRSRPASSSSSHTPSTRANINAPPCARNAPRGPCAPMPAASSIHFCERTAMALSASAKARIAPRRAHQRAHRFLIRRQRLQPAHQHVEQPFARRLLRHVAAAGKHRTVDVLHMGGEDRQRRAEFGAQGRKLEAGAAGDFGEPNVLEGMFGEQSHQRVDRLVAVGIAARRRRAGLCGNVLVLRAMAASYGLFGCA